MLLSRCYIVYIWTTSQSIVAPLRQVFLLILSITSSSAFLIISCSLFQAISAILWYLRSSVFFLIASAWVEILYRYLFYKSMHPHWRGFTGCWCPTLAFNLFWMSLETWFLWGHTRFFPRLTFASCSMPLRGPSAAAGCCYGTNNFS